MQRERCRSCPRLLGARDWSVVAPETRVISCCACPSESEHTCEDEDLRKLAVVALLGLTAVACGPSDEPARLSASTSSMATTTTVVTSTSTTTSTSTVPPDPVVDPSAPAFVAVTPDGQFTYAASYPSTDASNLRGTLLVDNGEGFVPALRDDRDVFDDIHGMIFGPSGLVAWTSDDYNKGPLVFVGRIDDSGRIVDTHRVGPDAEVIASVGFDDHGLLTATTSGGEPYVLDTALDPFFVMSSIPMPLIETGLALVEEFETEGFWARENPGFWYRGETLGTEPACGASTLYKDDADGFVRVLSELIELDTVAEVDVADDFDTGGVDSVGGARAVVLSTECPGQYDGRRVYWGLEVVDYGDNGPRFESPLYVEPAFDTAVAEVMGVTAVIVDDGLGCCLQVDGLQIDVELLDGTRTVLEVSTAN